MSVFVLMGCVTWSVLNWPDTKVAAHALIQRLGAASALAMADLAATGVVDGTMGAVVSATVDDDDDDGDTTDDVLL